MKRFFTLLSLVVLFSGLLPGQFASAAVTYSGADNSNDYVDSVIQNAGGVLTEKTTAASNGSSNDVTLYKGAGSELYLGYSNKFDGISADVYNSATGGSYSVEYWDGGSWATLVNNNSGSISDNTDGTFQVEWTRPSGWEKTNILMTTDEDGNAYQYSGSYFFVKLSIGSTYSSSPTFSQIGIINYNMKVTIEDQFGNTPSSYSSSYSFTSSSADAQVYVSKNAGNGTEYYGFFSPAGGAVYQYTATVTGYVQESSSISLDHTQNILDLNLDYTHRIFAEDSSTGNNVTISSAYAGTSNTTCTISSGVAYCPVPTSQDGSTATVSASGYSTNSVSIANRTSDSTAQQTAYVSMTSTGSSNNDPDLTVDDLYYENDAVWADISNEGDDDVSSSDTVYVYVYVDGSREYSGTIGYNYFGSGESTSFAFLADELTGDDSHSIEVCIDATDNVDEDDESDNCRTETLTMGGSSSDDADLTVNDLYFSGDYLYAEVSNEGGDDADDSVAIAVYVDGDREFLSSYSEGYFEEDETNTFSFQNDNIWDDGETYEIEICSDYYDDIDEDSESNNCRTEDLEFNGSSSNGDADLDVTDIYLDSDDELNFTVANVGDDDVDNGETVSITVYVDGDAEYTKSVTQSSSSTNFLDEGEEDTYSAGDILENEGSTYEVEVCVDTDDDVDEDSESNNCMTVDEDSIDTNGGSDSCGDFTDLDGEWSEPYFCNLYDRGVVDGRSDTRMYPDSTTTRAEALKMILLNAELDPYSVSSVHYGDVSSSSWYYSYVTYATAMGYVDGYSSGNFKPDQAITRAEFLEILMNVAEQDDFSFDESDIDFWDVDVNDWFAEVVVIADEDNLVDGYSDGSFGPYNSITRGEAAKILDLAYDQYFN